MPAVQVHTIGNKTCVRHSEKVVLTVDYVNGTGQTRVLLKPPSVQPGVYAISRLRLAVGEILSRTTAVKQLELHTHSHMYIQRYRYSAYSPYVACKSQSSRDVLVLGSGWVPQLSAPLSFRLPSPATKDVANRKFANQKRKHQDLL